MTIQYKKIPQEMKNLPNWVCWKYEDRAGKKTKTPHDPRTGGYAKSNDRKTWADFETAAGQSIKYDGIGFMLTASPFVGIDIDHCIEEGKIGTGAAEIIKKLGSYTEISPSGEGIHIISRARIQDGKGRRLGPVEIYPGGRFFTVTGNTLPGYEEIKPAQDVIDSMVKDIDNKRKQPETAKNKAHTAPIDIEDAEVIAKIRKSKQAAIFSSLYDQGDTSKYGNDDSAADIALMNILCFWTCGDEERMKKIFSASALGQREKWKREDYRKRTVMRALADWDGIGYDPDAFKKAQKTARNKAREGNPMILDCPEWPVTEEDQNGNIRPSKIAWENVAYLLENLGIEFRYNLLTKDVDINGCE